MARLCRRQRAKDDGAQRLEFLRRFLQHVLPHRFARAALTESGFWNGRTRTETSLGDDQLTGPGGVGSTITIGGEPGNSERAGKMRRMSPIDPQCYRIWVRHLMNSTTRSNLVPAWSPLPWEWSACAPKNTLHAPHRALMRGFSAFATSGNAFSRRQRRDRTSLRPRSAPPLTPSQSYFPQEARGFVQLNSFRHPLH